jgi:amino acid transporter
MLLGDGVGVPLATTIVMLLLLLFSVGYTAMSRHIANAGSFYAFNAQGLGGVAGGAAAYIAVLAYNTMQIGLYGLFGAVAKGTFETLPEPFNFTAPWWAWSLGALVIVAILGYRKIDLSAKILGVLVAVEYIVVLILDVAIVSKGGDSGLSMTSFTMDSLFSGSVSIGLLISFAGFMGFEATTIYSEEARDPEKTVPRATYVSVLVIGIFYSFTTWCMVNGAGADKLMGLLGGLQNPPDLVFILSDTFVGHKLTVLMSLLLISSVFAALLAFHNAAARYFYVLGREGLLPAALGQTHNEHQSPHLGSVLQTVLALVIVGIFLVTGQDPLFALFTWLTNLATLGLITLMSLVSVSVVVFFKRNAKLAPSAFKGFLAPIATAVLMGCVVVMVVVNFGALTGASEALAIGLPLMVPVAGVFGAIAASRLKQGDPKRYAEMGAHQPMS